MRQPIYFKRQRSKNELDNDFSPVQIEANKELYQIYAYKEEE